MRISISGTHSSGKTTVLNKLKRDKDLKTIRFIDGVTRKVKALGIPINEQGEDSTQLMCLSMDLHNLYTKRNEEIVISDRCLLDTFIYTKYLFQKGMVSQGTFEAIGLIWESHINFYDLILMPSHFEVPLADDGERSINWEFRDHIYRLFLEEINKHSASGQLKVMIVGGTVKQRIESIKELLTDKAII